jgi:hypothetical protein
MLINLSNHPSADWPDEQKAAAKDYGSIIDLPFPEIAPDGAEDYILSLVNEYIEKITTVLHLYPLTSGFTVHIMGEMTFTFAMIFALQQRGIRCIASTTKRVVEEKKRVKTSEFKFVRFRNYTNI